MSARPEPSKVTVACDSLAAVTVIVVTLRSREHSHIEGVFEEEGAFKCRQRASSRHALKLGRRQKSKRLSNSWPAVVGSNGLRGILIRRDVFYAVASALMRAVGHYSSFSRDRRPLSALAQAPPRGAPAPSILLSLNGTGGRTQGLLGTCALGGVGASKPSESAKDCGGSVGGGGATSTIGGEVLDGLASKEATLSVVLATVASSLRRRASIRASQPQTMMANTPDKTTATTVFPPFVRDRACIGRVEIVVLEGGERPSPPLVRFGTGERPSAAIRATTLSSRFGIAASFAAALPPCGSCTD
jgi:hypothetical protein